jgi:hypothetical protein
MRTNELQRPERQSFSKELVLLLIPDFMFLWATKPMVSSYSK